MEEDEKRRPVDDGLLYEKQATICWGMTFAR